ncbi:hypothetical protein OEZ86_001692 [Tetradesmus obliquus]|nr:hypothetical protein OEZ86_001692 [Tetradesmus obliquus]
MRHASSDMGLGGIDAAAAAAAAAGGMAGAGGSAASLGGSRAGSSAYLAGEDGAGLPELPASQIVKLSCDYFCRPMLEPMVGAIRTQSHYIQHKMGPVTCMAWHPYNLYLGAAGNDSVASVYIVDNVPTANPGSGVSYAPTTVSSAGLGGGGNAAVMQQQQSASLMYAGEESAGYESTCRGRIETGQQTSEWAMRWNETTQDMQFGYYCGCSGCTSGCWNANLPPTARNNVTKRFNCSSPAPGTLPPYPQANRFWPYWFTGPDFAPNTNPNTTATGACNDPRYTRFPNNFPYPICKGRTAAFGEEWGSMDSDFTCKTYNSLVVDSPNFFCTTDPKDSTAFPPPPTPGKPARLMGLAPSSRLDFVMGASEPASSLPTREAVMSISPAALTRTEEVLP